MLASTSASDAPRRARRLFIGPLPEKLLFAMHEVVDATGNDDESFDALYAPAVREVLDRNAHAFFLLQGGNAKDWNETTRENLRDELIKRWQDCPWTRPLRHKRPRTPGTSTHWVGNTFEVGSILGVGVLNSHAPTPSADSTPTTPAAPEPLLSQQGLQAPYASTTALSSVGPRSYWTARSHLSPPTPHSPQPSSSTASLPEQHGGDVSALSSDSPLLAAASAPSLPTEHTPRQEVDAPRSILKRPSSKPRPKRRGVSLLERNAKRQVRMRQKDSSDDDEDRPGDGPASPTAVLARMGDDVAECSAGMTPEAAPLPGVSSDVFLRDRMLVRVCHTKSESLPTHFDEAQNRQTINMRHEDCMEFLVVWRKDMLELYEDYTIPAKEHILGHKRLAFVIPLVSQRTSVSLYSFVDLTFCILCPPTSVRERYSRARAFHLFPKDEGTNVFVFKVKSRTRAQDWLWHLWRRLGGKIPPSLMLRCPEVDLRICFDVPAHDNLDIDKAYDTFCRRNIVDMVERSLSRGSSHSASKTWNAIIERELRAGKKLELAWRFGGQLDWMWHERDIEGNLRPWAVLSGLSLSQGMRSAHLELRIAEHLPDCVHLQAGNKLSEPPAIEGYLERVRQQGRQRVYLVIHGDSLFSLLPSDASPPLPPSGHVSRLMSGLKPSVEEYSQSLFQSEVWRGAEQIRHAHGMLDLSAIRAVRRAYGPLSEDDGQHVPCDAEDARDAGGHQGHAQSQDRVQLHLRRTFDVLLASGVVVRLEAHSAHDCVEWVTRLRALVTYWDHRHRVDVKEEMDVAFSASTHARLTPRMLKCHHAAGHQTPSEPPINAEPPVLTSLYNWCTLSTCRSIIKAGRAFSRKGLRGQYQLVQLCLIPGRLIQFNMSPTATLNHRYAKEIGLLDAYVCSGYFAALALRRSEYSPELPNLPRRYEDGLETDEREEDELFVIWYRPSSVPAVAAPQGERSNAPTGGFQATQPVPRLSRKGFKLAVFRTRSKVERDAWCWTLGCEIEKVARDNRERERRVREAGGLVQLGD